MEERTRGPYALLAIAPLAIAVALPVAIVGFVLVGWLAAREDTGGFDWELASIFGTAASTVLLASATVGVVVAAVKALGSLDDARITRHAQLVTDLSRRWDEPLAIESLKLHGEEDVAGILLLIERIYAVGEDPSDADRESRRADIDRWFTHLAVLNLIETMGVLHTDGAIAADVIFRLWGPSIVSAWEKWDEPIRRMRELEKRPNIYRPFEDLYGLMKARLDEEDELSVSEAESAKSRSSQPEEEVAEVDSRGAS